MPRCKNCQTNIRKEEKAIPYGLSYIHDRCFKDFTNKLKIQKRMKKKKPKKKGQAWFKKKAIELAKVKAKERDNYTCQYCGLTRDVRQIQASHVFGTGQKSFLAGDIENIKALCAYHHLRWWHSQPLEAAEWFEKKFPKRMKSLKQKIKDHNTGDKINWEEIYNNLKK